MDEESRRERIVPGPSSPFPQRKAGSEDCRETSAEARLLEGGAAALESEEIALPAGPGTSYKTGGGQAFPSSSLESHSHILGIDRTGSVLVKVS